MFWPIRMDHTNYLQVAIKTLHSFMKTVLNKKARDFKKKDDLINTLKKEYNKMKNFGIDLNENAQAEKKIKKIEKTIKKGITNSMNNLYYPKFLEKKKYYRNFKIF